jgi:hypothetical protein
VTNFHQQSTEPAVPVPRSVDVARWLWIGTTVLGLVRSLVQLSDRGQLIADLRKLAPQMSQEQIDNAANSGILFTVVFSLAVLALYVMLATQLVRGRNWARVVIAILGGLSAIGTVIMLIAVFSAGPAAAIRATGVAVPSAPWDIAFSLLVAAMDIVTLVLLFRPESNRFFRDSARARRTGVGSAAE